jgi:hypothetical protein
MACAGDPGDEQVVGVVDEMVTSERVDEVALATQMRRRDGHELTLAGRRRYCPGAGEKTVFVDGKERRSHEDDRVVAGAGRLDDRRDCGGVTDHELMKQVLGERRRHGTSIESGADTTLTPS